MIKTAVDLPGVTMRLITVEPVLFAYVFTVALLQPLLQQYIYGELSQQYNFTKRDENVSCKNETDKNVTSLENMIQTKASYWILAISISTCVPSVITTFLFGTLSDVVGRKPMVLLALIGAFVHTLVVTITVTFGFTFYTVLLGSFIEGLTGSFAAVVGSCLAYITDITNNKSRSLRVGVLEACILAGATASFLIGGVWLDSSGYAPPFWLATGLLCISCIYTAFFLPESFEEKQGFSNFSFTTHLKRIKNFICAKRGPYVNVCLVLLLVSFLFAVFDYFGGVIIIYTKHYPLCWGSELIGFYLATKIACASLGIAFSFKVLTRVMSETMLVMIGCLSYMLSNVMVGFANSTEVMFLTCIPVILAAVSSPCIRSIATKMVEKHEEGTLCSLLAVTEAIAQLCSPLVFNTLYPVSLKTLHVNGFVFFLQAGILLIPILLFSIIHYLNHKHQNILYNVLKEEVSTTVQT